MALLGWQGTHESQMWIVSVILLWLSQCAMGKMITTKKFFVCVCVKPYVVTKMKNKGTVMVSALQKADNIWAFT